MCTVTFIPVNGRYYLTSNRDEHRTRQQAFPPHIYRQGQCKIIYPKDANAGGSWIALHENGNAGVLLNGAFQKHFARPPYKASRGIIFLEIMNAPSPVRYFMRADFTGIEPFTMIIMDKFLYECRWTGTLKCCTQQNKYRPHIWSSATLYDPATVRKREQWFAVFLAANPFPSQDDIIHFHEFGGTGDLQNDLKMNRHNSISTVSITSILMDDSRSNMKYLDLKDYKIYLSKTAMAIPLVLSEIF